MKRFSTFITAGCALAFVGTASAQFNPTPRPAPGDAPSSMNQLDTNHDGSISPGEAAANPALSDQFLQLDTNGDGALEPSEFSRFEVLGASTTRGTPGARGSMQPGITTPPPMTTTPPPMTTTPPPMGTTPPPMGSTPPPSTSTPPPQ